MEVSATIVPSLKTVILFHNAVLFAGILKGTVGLMKFDADESPIVTTISALFTSFSHA